jgi:hypothetical protein
MLVFWSHSVFRQNYLYVRMLQIGIPLFNDVKIRRTFKFPVSRPDDVSSRPDARQSSIIRPDDVFLPS